MSFSFAPLACPVCTAVLQRTPEVLNSELPMAGFLVHPSSFRVAGVRGIHGKRMIKAQKEVIGEVKVIIRISWSGG